MLNTCSCLRGILEHYSLGGKSEQFNGNFNMQDCGIKINKESCFKKMINDKVLELSVKYNSTLNSMLDLFLSIYCYICRRLVSLCRRFGFSLMSQKKKQQQKSCQYLILPNKHLLAEDFTL